MSVEAAERNPNVVLWCAVGIPFIAACCWWRILLDLKRLWFPNLQSEPNGEQNNTTESSWAPTPETLAVREVDDYQIRETIDEVEVSLTGVNQNEGDGATPNSARGEFLSNLLLSKKVVIRHQENSSTGMPTDKKEEVWLISQDSELEADTCSNTDEDGAMQCAICLVDYQPGDVVCCSHNKRCPHHFHQECIFSWLLQDRSDCPCCRNNYLALSDDEDETNDSTSQEQSNDPTVRDTIAEDPWVPSYLAPFTSQTGNEQSIATDLSLPNVESGRWTDDEESQSRRAIDEDPDAWSCPSVQDSIPEPVSELSSSTVRAIRRLQRLRRQAPPCAQVERNDQIQSLTLGDLVVEGLMRRLEDRRDDGGCNSGSSSSVYTEGSDADANSANPPLHDESEACAICRHEYTLNQELCWSQDPACAHVFHRDCMEQWILDGHDYCPLCMPSPSDDVGLPDSNSRSSSRPDDSCDADDETTSSEILLDTELRVVTSLELQFGNTEDSQIVSTDSPAVQNQDGKAEIQLTA